MMNGTKKSDSSIVPAKPANKVERSTAELVEGYDGTKRNAELQSTVRTQSRAAVSQAQARIREAVFTREAVPRHHPRWEPGALAAPAGICAGGGEKSPSLPRPPDVQGFFRVMHTDRLRSCVRPFCAVLHGPLALMGFADRVLISLSG